MRIIRKEERIEGGVSNGNESCQGSVPAAMRYFYESTDFESFMRNIYSIPCDSDTFGAIAGGSG